MNNPPVADPPNTWKEIGGCGGLIVESGSLVRGTKMTGMMLLYQLGGIDSGDEGKLVLQMASITIRKNSLANLLQW